MEKDFNELLRLLRIQSFNELLLFENGKLKDYHDLYEFKYKIRTLCEVIYHAASGMTNDVHFDQIILTSKKLTMDLIYSLTDKQRLLDYVSNK